MFYFVNVYLALLFALAGAASIATGIHYWPLCFIVGVPQALFMLAAQSGPPDKVMSAKRAFGVASAAGSVATILSTAIVVAILGATGFTLDLGTLAWVKPGLYIGAFAVAGLFAAWSTAFYRQLRAANARETVVNLLMLLTSVAAFTVIFGAVSTSLAPTFTAHYLLGKASAGVGLLVLMWTVGPWLGAIWHGVRKRLNLQGSPEWQKRNPKVSDKSQNAGH